LLETTVPTRHYGKDVVSSTLERLEKIAIAIERQGVLWPFLLFFPIYLSIAVITARHKLIWDDEFFTLYISRPDSMRGILDALRTGADQHPPLFYYLTHQVTSLFGTSHLTLRALPIAGYALMCVCLFYLLYRRTSVLWAFLGMTLPLASSAFYYATEARGYGLVLGFCALALLSWQRVTSLSAKRGYWLAILFVACAMAVSSHYYAVLFVFALGLGELARTIQLRRADILVWLCFLGGAVPLVVFSKTILGARTYSGHFWATPIWGSLMDFYPGMFGNLANVLVLGSIPYLVALLRSESHEESYRSEICRFSTYEVVAWASIAAVPLFAMILAKTVTHGYIERYALSGIIGGAVLLCHFGFAVAPRPRSFPLILSSVSLLFFVFHSIWIIRIQKLNVSALAEQMQLLDSHSSSPIVLSDITVFHQTSFYAPRRVIRNVVYVTDPQASVEYLSHDTIDRGLWELRQWFPLNIVPRSTFVSQHREFLVYTYVGSWSWLTYVLLPPQYQTTLLDRYRTDVLLRARRIGDEPENSADTTQSLESGESLFDKTSKDGPSLCKQWMPKDDFCDVIEQRRLRVPSTGKPEGGYK
jgi:4-amino-4-deoxy-L-arabinose transferase and related glycosyltransferases of PMT family